FLEGGVGWARSLFADLIGHWEKRNIKALANYDPANIDQELLAELSRRSGGRAPRRSQRRLRRLCDREQGGFPPTVPQAVFLRLRSRRSDHGFGLRRQTQSDVGPAQRDLRLRYRSLRRPRHERSNRRSLRSGRAWSQDRGGFSRFRIRQPDQALERAQSRLLQRHGGGRRGEQIPEGKLTSPPYFLRWLRRTGLPACFYIRVERRALNFLHLKESVELIGIRRHN